VFDLDSGRSGSPEDILPNSINAPPIIHLSEKLREKNIDIRTPLSIQDARERIEKTRVSFNPKSWPVQHPSSKKIASIKNLTTAFNGRRILDAVNIDLYRGQFTALMGKNGAGKTTLVKHLNGLMKAAEGTIIVLGNDVSATSLEQMAHFVGFVSQNPNDYLTQETVLKELEFTARNLDIPCDAEKIFVSLGLTGLKNAYPRDLSGGERQRVALASVLVGNPELIIFDEPTRGMDASSKRDLTCMLTNLRGQGKAILLVTHDVEFAASSAERVIILDDGKVVADGPAHEVLNECELFRPQVSQIFPGKHYLTVNDALEAIR
jgi:energy-coupling factor transport system ATP-binding protein